MILKKTYESSRINDEIGLKKHQNKSIQLNACKTLKSSSTDTFGGYSTKNQSQLAYNTLGLIFCSVVFYKIQFYILPLWHNLQLGAGKLCRR